MLLLSLSFILNRGHRNELTLFSTSSSTEVLFERSLLGNSQSGVGECLSWVLRDSSRHLFADNDSTDNSWIPRRLFLTGGPAALPGMSQRLRPELQQLLPWKVGGNPLDVVVAGKYMLSVFTSFFYLGHVFHPFIPASAKQLDKNCRILLAENLLLLL